MRSFAILSFVSLACSPAPQSLTAQGDRATAIANGTDSVTISAIRTTPEGVGIVGVVDFTVSSGGKISATHVMSDATGTAKTVLTSTAAGEITVTATVPGTTREIPILLTASVGIRFDAPAGPKLRFQTSPSNTQAQNLLRPIPVVVVEDASGNVMTSSTASITVAVDPLSCSASLDSTSMMTVTASQGTSSFYGLKITTPVTGCRLKATSGDMQAGISTPFDILP